MELGTNAQVGAGVTTGITLHVRLTSELKPLMGAAVIVEVADPPAATDAGDSGDAEIWKLGGGAACTESAIVCE
jgi:hypothetical protein